MSLYNIPAFRDQKKAQDAFLTRIGAPIQTGESSVGGRRTPSGGRGGTSPAPAPVVYTSSILQQSFASREAMERAEQQYQQQRLLEQLRATREAEQLRRQQEQQRIIQQQQTGMSSAFISKTDFSTYGGGVTVGSFRYFGGAVIPEVGLTATQFKRQLREEAVARGEIRQSDIGRAWFKGSFVSYPSVKLEEPTRSQQLQGINLGIYQTTDPLSLRGTYAKPPPTVKDYNLFLKPTVLAVQTDTLRDPTTGRKVPFMEYSLFTPPTTTGAWSTTRILSQEEIEKYFPRTTTDVTGRPTFKGTVTTQFSELVFKQDRIGEGSGTLFGREGYIGKGKDYVTDFGGRLKLPEEDFFGKSVVQKSLDFRAGVIRGVVPETKRDIAFTGLTFGAGAIIGGTGKLGLNIATAYTPRLVDPMTKGFKVAGVVGGGLFLGTQTVKAVSIGTAKGYGEVFGETTRYGVAFLGGSKVGTRAIDSWKYTRSDTEIIKVRTFRPTQLDKGAIVKGTVLGRAGEYQISTPKGSPLRSGREGTIWLQETVTTYKTYSPFKAPKISTITSPKFTAINIREGDLILGGKTLKGGLIGFKGSGVRTDITFGKEVAVSGRDIGLRDFFSKQTTRISLRGTGMPVGKGIDVQTARVYSSPVERMTYRGRFGRISSELLLEGKSFGRGFTGRPTTTKAIGFDLTRTVIDAPQGRIIYGQAVGKFITGQKASPYIFTTKTTYPSRDIISIDFRKGTGTFKPPRTKTTRTGTTFLSEQQTETIQRFSKVVSLSPTKSPTISPTVLRTQTLTTSVYLTTAQQKRQQTRQATAFRTPTSQVSPVLTSQMFVATQKTAFRQALSPALVQFTSTTQAQRTAFETMQIFRTPTVRTPITTRATIGMTPPPFIPFLPITFKPSFKTGVRARSIFGRRARLKYTPDFPSLVLGRKGKPVKTRTGFEIRPIPKGYRWEY